MVWIKTARAAAVVRAIGKTARQSKATGRPVRHWRILFPEAGSYLPYCGSNTTPYEIPAPAIPAGPPEMGVGGCSILPTTVMG